MWKFSINFVKIFYKFCKELCEKQAKAFLANGTSSRHFGSIRKNSPKTSEKLALPHSKKPKTNQNPDRNLNLVIFLFVIGVIICWVPFHLSQLLVSAWIVKTWKSDFLGSRILKNWQELIFCDWFSKITFFSDLFGRWLVF